MVIWSGHFQALHQITARPRLQVGKVTDGCYARHRIEEWTMSPFAEHRQKINGINAFNILATATLTASTGQVWKLGQIGFAQSSVG